MRLFANVIPVQRMRIPWGWENKRTPHGFFSVNPPGKIAMPDLTKYFYWDQYIVEDMGFAADFGTRNMKSIFITASRFLGWEELLISEPDLSPITDGYLAWNSRLAAAWDGRLKWFMLGDDVAYNRGLLIRPDWFRQWIIPQHKRLVDAAHGWGMKVILHSDGDLWDVLDDYANLGVDALCYQPVNRMEALAERPEVIRDNLHGFMHGDMLCFINEDADRPNTNMMRFQEGEE